MAEKIASRLDRYLDETVPQVNRDLLNSEFNWMPVSYSHGYRIFN
jgi:hypothetical protein